MVPGCPGAARGSAAAPGSMPGAAASRRAGTPTAPTARGGRGAGGSERAIGVVVGGSWGRRCERERDVAAREGFFGTGVEALTSPAFVQLVVGVLPFRGRE